MSDIPRPEEPVRVAIIGAGNRSQTVYVPLMQDLAAWMRPVAVCDPVKEHADRAAARLGVPAYADIRALVSDSPMEAALVVTPEESHHSISVYLSTHGVHNLIETPWCTTAWQGRDMLAVAKQHGVLVGVAEQFFRMPIDRSAQVVRDLGVLGDIQRVVCYGDHTGFHNNSRWIVFNRSHPQWVQCVEHGMEMASCHSEPQRRHSRETLTCRFYGFSENRLVMDAATVAPRPKGHWGRCPRPGYTEWQGYRGTLVLNGTVGGSRDAEIRRFSDQRLADGAAGKPFTDKADEVAPLVHVVEGHNWIRSYADVGGQRLEYANPWRYRQPLRCHPDQPGLHLPSTGACVMETLVDFALAVRGLRDLEFTGEDALMSLMMEIGAHESALNEGKRVELPLREPVEVDELETRRQSKSLGCDPRDVEAMLAVSFAKP